MIMTNPTNTLSLEYTNKIFELSDKILRRSLKIKKTEYFISIYFIIYSKNQKCCHFIKDHEAVKY